jgi:hypothetical protein
LRSASDFVVWGERVFGFAIRLEINIDSKVLAISIDIACVVAERHATGDHEKFLYISPGHADFYALKIVEGPLDNTTGVAITSLSL